MSVGPIRVRCVTILIEVVRDPLFRGPLIISVYELYVLV